MLVTSSGAFGPTSGGYASISLTLGTQWSPSPSSSYEFFYPYSLSLRPLLCPHSSCL
ncbi:hypothetical protein BHE74_00036117 [Ensete ventricosum]|uniref:Uncharacterized protein n=1 Tax=Ensete ventricosum TaxID=4639 RepID=A0A444CZF6_ENSVE|nr:hypothetical protein GW17_00046449 [Ensete ventricosum]RWW57116.1 hypothetical protein BHE74_00036117 [Ensete ventricosum]RZR74843.1 hypothetical protein BHM03_00044700 [Ensete ventricosum]